MSYSVVERGQPNTLNYRIFFRQANGNIISPFHDIPLYYDEKNKICNMVVEIPRWTNAKMEICKEEKLNPIKQDVKKGKLRYVKNIFPHHGYIWNYGALPQTWENPSEVYQDTKTSGDNDPLDVCEIGHKIHKRGAVIQVKILGTMLLIDEGETDWKIIAIDVTDPLADKLTDTDDIEREMPGFLKATYQWFRYYKVPDGKPENTVHWDGACQRRGSALEVIDSANKQWKKLMSEPPCGKGISCTNTTVSRCSKKVTAEASQSLMDEAHPDPFCLSGSPPQKRQKKEDRSQALVQSESVDSEVDKWHYVIPQSQ